MPFDKPPAGSGWLHEVKHGGTGSSPATREAGRPSGAATAQSSPTGSAHWREWRRRSLADTQNLIGLARPFCLDPDFPVRMLAGHLQRLPVAEDR